MAGWTRLEWSYTSSAAGNTRQSRQVAKDNKRVECLWVHPDVDIDPEVVAGSGGVGAEGGN